jgi:hypothetical protein
MPQTLPMSPMLNGAAMPMQTFAQAGYTGHRGRRSDYQKKKERLAKEEAIKAEQTANFNAELDAIAEEYKAMSEPEKKAQDYVEALRKNAANINLGGVYELEGKRISGKDLSLKIQQEIERVEQETQEAKRNFSADRQMAAEADIENRKRQYESPEEGERLRYATQYESEWDKALEADKEAREQK